MKLEPKRHKTPTNPQRDGAARPSALIPALVTSSSQLGGQKVRTTGEPASPVLGLEAIRGILDPPLLKRAALSTKFGTVGQRNALGVEEMDRANEAAFQEAIARSRQERAFGILVKPEPQATQRSTIQTPDRTTNVMVNPAGRQGPPSEVSEANRAAQMLGFADLNKAFRAHLDKHDLQVTPNPGMGNNCAIYALVQHVRPDLTSSKLDDEVSELRKQYNKGCPSDVDQLLHLDTGVGGAANPLIGLVNKRYGVNIQVGVVEAGIDKANPVTSKEPISASGASASFTHRLVIWDQQGHYEVVTANPDNRQHGLRARDGGNPSGRVDTFSRARAKLDAAMDRSRKIWKQTKAVVHGRNARETHESDRLYQPENIIGSTGAPGQLPTVYYRTNSGTGGHITQEHKLVDNIGREPPRKYFDHQMANTGSRGNLVETVDGVVIHTSRNPFVPAVTAEERQVLSTAHEAFPDIKKRYSGP